MRSTVLALGVALLPAAALGEPASGACGSAPPLPWREPAPPAAMFLQLPFEAPEVLEAHAFRIEVQLLYANSILVAGSPSLAVDVDLESAELLAILRHGLAPGLEVQLAVPAMVDYGGFLDGIIAAVEHALGATPMPGRSGRPYGLARFRLVRPDGTGVLRDGPGAGLGDVWAGLKARLADGSGGWPAISLRGALKLPTGRPPYGSGEVDVGAGLLAGWTSGVATLRLELDAVVPTASFRAARIPTRPYGAGQIGVAIGASSAVSLHAQWSSHLSPFAETGLPPLDAPTHYAVLGASLALSRSVSLEAGVAENVFSPASGADLTLLAGVRVAP